MLRYFGLTRLKHAYLFSRNCVLLFLQELPQTAGQPTAVTYAGPVFGPPPLTMVKRAVSQGMKWAGRSFKNSSLQVIRIPTVSTKQKNEDQFVTWLKLSVFLVLVDVVTRRPDGVGQELATVLIDLALVPGFWAIRKLQMKLNKIIILKLQVLIQQCSKLIQYNGRVLSEREVEWGFKYWMLN